MLRKQIMKISETDKFLRILYKPYVWFIYLPLLGIMTVFFGILSAIVATIVSPRAGSITGSVWARVIGTLAPMKVSIIGRENVDPRQSYVIISNHRSLFDVVVLYGWIGIDFKWVMKQELRKIPGLGIGCEKIGHVFIDRSNSEKAIASINAAKDRLINGTSVIFFPEGRRSDTNEMREFKKGAFKLALEFGLPILPVTLVNTSYILPNKTLDLLPGTAKIVFHKPIDIKNYSDTTMQDLMEKSRSVLQAGIDRYEAPDI
jgi:1-acyl-sn-glycerol-3-phosphate acyltransferase